MINIKKETLKLVLDLQKMSKSADKLSIRNDRIRRLKKRAIAEDAEDRLAEFLFNVLDDKKIEIYINGSINGLRPDIIILKDNVVIAIVELKMNFGWCRNIFDPKIDNKYRYSERSQIHERFKTLEKLKNKDISFDNGSENISIKLSSKYKLFYVSTSEENYLGNTNMKDDFKQFIKDNPLYKNIVYFSVLTERYHYDRLKDEWPKENEISESIDVLFDTEFGINKLIERIKREL